MKIKKTKQEIFYRIRVRESLDPNITDWFGGVALIPQEGGGTLLTGHFPDQAALRGFLDQLWNLHFTVVSVEKVESGSQSDPIVGRKEKLI